MKPTYSNDRSAPRMRKAKYSINLVSKDSFKKFKDSFPEHKDMKWEDFSNNWLDIAETIRKEIIENPLGIKLGSYTGELKLQYLPYKQKAVDIDLSNKLGEKIDHLNITTKGKVAIIKWERRWAVKFNRMLQFFAFQATRKLNVDAKKYIDSHPEKLRVSRAITGGVNVWKKLKPRKNDS
jgi:hypothetical protein